MTSAVHLPADAERVYRRLQGAIAGNVIGAPASASGSGTTDRRAIAVLTQIMRPQSYRLPVVRLLPDQACECAMAGLKRAVQLALQI